MKKEVFIKSLYQSVIKENRTIYQDLFENTDVNTVKDSYWKEALRFYSELNDEGKEILFKVIEQIQVDTVSNGLGIFDGKVSISGEEIIKEECYEKARFIKEGLLRDSRKNGDEYWSLWEMSILENEWLKTKNAYSYQ
jgi:hypothetical protein